MSGCIKFDTDIQISGSTVDMTMLIAMQDEYADSIGEECAPVVEAGRTVTPYNEDGFIGCIHEMKGVPLAELADAGPDLSIVHEDGQYTFTMAMSELGDGSTDDAQMTAALFTDFRVAVEFPAEVTSHNGSSTVDGTTVTWTNAMDLASDEGLRATSREPNPVLALLPWIGAGLLVAAGVVIGLLLLWNRARTPQPVITPAEAWTTQPPAPAGGAVGTQYGQWSAGTPSAGQPTPHQHPRDELYPNGPVVQGQEPGNPWGPTP
ncbi:LppM family (lipo)protein [Tessaracoccus sp. Z1128]